MKDALVCGSIFQYPAISHHALNRLASALALELADQNWLRYLFQPIPKRLLRFVTLKTSVRLLICFLLSLVNCFLLFVLLGFLFRPVFVVLFQLTSNKVLLSHRPLY